MNSLAELIALPAPESGRVMGRRHDDDPDDMRRHIDCAADRILRGVTVAECQVRYRLASNKSVYRYIEYALKYEDPVSEILRRVVTARQSA